MPKWVTQKGGADFLKVETTRGGGFVDDTKAFLMKKQWMGMANWVWILVSVVVVTLLIWGAVALTKEKMEAEDDYSDLLDEEGFQVGNQSIATNVNPVIGPGMSEGFEQYGGDSAGKAVQAYMGS